MKLLIAVFSAISLLSTVLAQPPAALWSQTYGGMSAEQCYAFDMTSDGGYVLVGYTQSFDLAAKQMWLVKTDAGGDSLWSRMYGGNEWEECWFVKQVADGGYVLAGKTYSYGNGQLDFWLVKTDSDGNVLWNRTYGTSAVEDLRAAVQTPDGGYALAGFTYPYGSSDKNYWLVKTDANGDSLWSRTYGGPGMDYCLGIEQTDDSGFLLMGYSNSFGVGGNDIWIVRTDANGDSLWSRTYGGTLDEYGQSVRQTADGGFILYGGTMSFGGGNYDIWLLKTNANGDTLWTRTFGADSSDTGIAVALTHDGGLLLAGSTRSFGMGQSDGWIIRTDADGDSLWSMVLGGTGYDVFYSVRQAADGSCLCAGHTSSSGVGSTDFWLVKTESELNAEDRLILPPSSFRLSIFPNPFNPSATITYDLPKAMHARLRIFDISGRLMTTLADEHVSAGIHSLTFNGSAFSSGTYFARISASGQSQTVKMQLVK